MVVRAPAIEWLPDLPRWGQIVARYLRPGGAFFLADGHPTMWMFDGEAPDGFHVKYPYFQPPAPLDLQRQDLIDEGRPSMRRGDALGLLQGDDIGCRLLDHAEAFHLELAEDRRLSGSRHAGEDEALHPGSAAIASRNGPTSSAAKGSHLSGSLAL